MLFCSKGMLLRLFGGLGALGGNGPLGELHPYTVRAGLDDDALILYGADRAEDAADGGDFIPDLQGAAHLVELFFLLVLIIWISNRMTSWI